MPLDPHGSITSFDAGSGPYAEAALLHFDNACGITPGNVDHTGTVTISAVTATEVTGTADITALGDTIHVTFVIPICAPTDGGQVDGGQVSCNFGPSSGDGGGSEGGVMDGGTD